MKYLIKIDYCGYKKDPILSQRGMGALLNYANNLEGILDGVDAELIAPIFWECHEPIGYAVFEAEDEKVLQPLVKRFGPHPKVSIKQVRFIPELIELGTEILPTLK